MLKINFKINKKILDRIFELVILIKSFFGFFEILAGIIFAISGKLIVNNIIIAFAQQEIADDKNDFLANFLINSLHDFSAGTYLFTVIYLILHGIINIFLGISLMKNKIWAYPWAVAGFSFFITYQILRYFYTHSILLLFLTLFDIFIVILVLLEYKNKKKVHLVK